MNARWAILLVLLPGILVVLFIAYAVAVVGGAFESIYAEEGTLEYYLIGVSSVIKDVPRVGNSMDVRFHTSSGDGPKPPSSTIYYSTDASQDEVRRAIISHVVKSGFKPVADLEFAKHGSLVGINVRPYVDEKCECDAPEERSVASKFARRTSVEVTELEEYYDGATRP